MTYIQFLPRKTMNREWIIGWHYAFEVRKILNRSLIDDEGNEFPIGSMMFEGEYVTLYGKSRITSGHVFVDYRPGYVVYHFTNLIFCTNIHLQIISNDNSTNFLTPLMLNN